VIKNALQQALQNSARGKKKIGARHPALSHALILPLLLVRAGNETVAREAPTA
jgi:hypothetical protein